MFEVLCLRFYSRHGQINFNFFHLTSLYLSCNFPHVPFIGLFSKSILKGLSKYDYWELEKIGIIGGDEDILHIRVSFFCVGCEGL
jgi:hypothetical protein